MYQCTSPGDGQTTCKVCLASGERRRCSNEAKTRNSLKFAGVPQTRHVSAVSGPKWGHVDDKSLYPDDDPDRHQYLIICSLAHCQPSVKILWKSVRKFLRKVANRQTNKQRRKHVLLGGGKNNRRNCCNSGLNWAVQNTRRCGSVRRALHVQTEQRTCLDLCRVVDAPLRTVFGVNAPLRCKRISLDICSRQHLLYYSYA